MYVLALEYIAMQYLWVIKMKQTKHYISKAQIIPKAYLGT